MKELLVRGLDRGARVVAVCDVDKQRAESAAAMVKDFYKAKAGKDSWTCAVYQDFRELLEKEELDGVTVSTPDHGHAAPAIAAAKAGKHIYIQKPLTYSIAEGQQLVKAVRSAGVTLQTGSQQRSSSRFRHACELALNGRLGKVHTIIAQLPPDSGTGRDVKMPVPGHLDYNLWLGPTPVLPYTEHRVHPDKGFSRPGWLQIEKYCRGMITGWGAHMLDIAQWGNGCDRSGLVEISGTAEYPKRGLFDVHTKISAEGRYANGVRLIVRTGSAGVTFQGEKGNIVVTRSYLKTDPRAIAKEKIGEGEIRLQRSDNHMADFLDAIREKRDPVAPVEVGHRSNSACVITHIATKLGRPLKWDPKKEVFVGDDEANALLDFPHRDWQNA